MAKRRQIEFQRNKLKVGRPAGSKKRTIGANAFKAKKMIKQPKPASGSSIKDILQKINEDASTSTKFNYLMDLHTLVKNNSEILRRNLCAILDSVLALTIDTDEKVRKLCVDILTVAFEETEDIHLHNYLARITSTIICLMKSSSNHSKLLSLSLLYTMLKHHSNIIVHCMPLLNSILNLVNFSPRKHYASVPNASSPKGRNTYSPKFQINVLGHMNFFLQELIGKMTEEPKEEEVVEAFFDGKGPTRWANISPEGYRQQWYRREKSYVKSLDLQNPYFDNSGLIEEFIQDFISCVPLIYIEEMSSVMDNDDKLLSRETIKNLSIIFEALSKVGEWAKLISFTMCDTIIERFLQESIFNFKRFPFSTTNPVGGRVTQFLPCVQLNLAICHLCVEYLVLPGKANDMYNDKIFSYLKMVLGKSEKVMPYEIKYQSIPMILKIIKVYLNMANDLEVSDFLNVCLDHLCSLVKTNDDRENQKQLISFLLKMSVDPACYNFVAESDSMRIFFNWLLRELREKNCKLDKKYFKTIKRIANLKYPVFVQVVSKLNFVALKTLLRHDSKDVRDTAIIIIYHMEEISNSLLENLSQFILEDRCFPKAEAARLVRLLRCRFFDNPTDDKSEISSVYSSTGFVNFTLFLIHLAIDLCNINDEKMNTLDDSEFGTALKAVSNSHPYDIIPSLHWEDHEELFDVCLKCLKQLPLEPVTEILMTLVCSILNTSSVPMHCAIALMKLDDEKLLTAEPYRVKMRDLTFSCLMTLSILTQQELEDDWYQWNVNALQDSMELTTEKVAQTIDFVESIRYDVQEHENESFVVYNFLRIFQFFHAKGLVNSDYAERIFNLLQFFKETCTDTSTMRQPLFIEMFELFSSYE